MTHTRRRIVCAIIVELSAHGRTVAICSNGLSHLVADSVVGTIENLRRAANRNGAGAGFARRRLVTSEVTVTADGTREADVRRFPTAGTRVAAVACVVTVFTTTTAVECTIVFINGIVVVVEKTVFKSVGITKTSVVVVVVEVVEVPLADEVAFSRHSDDLSKAMPQKII